ncbi:MAG: hypothetical protein CME65_13250 [Halobacteriovoraceae bacterium]|nr:hypothetical protein [Halobacteriovoraceae bacterium]
MKNSKILSIFGLFCLFITFSIRSMAQVSIQQSRSDINWKSIESDAFKVVYPDYLEEKAHYTMAMLNYYAPLVGKTYQHQAKKITIVIRPNNNVPNGFVTLAPRRSEWFYTNSITPTVGASEWLQALAVHEYRHVVQFDSMTKSWMLAPYYLFGESFLSFFINIVMPVWYFEGDATWAETVYTDAGRGRSPRFSKRFKAQILNDQAPQYDTILGSDFRTSQPSWYVYGYYLVARAVKIYGEDVWDKILKDAIASPWNVYTFYSAFEKVTGKNFDEFYEESIEDLKNQWEQINPQYQAKPPSEYTRKIYPLPGKLYLQRSLDSLWELKQGKKTLAELNVVPSLSRVDAKKNKFLYTSPLPDKRYGFQGLSELFEFDLTRKVSKRLSYHKRYYHPQYSPNGKYIVVTSIDKNDRFDIRLLKGRKILKRIKPKEDYSVYSEAVWSSDDELILIKIDLEGKKSLVHYFIKSGDEIELTPPTRSNLYSLHYHNEEVYFEADYKGAVNIFSLELGSSRLSQCSDEPIGAFQPRIIGEKLYYSFEDTNGEKLKSRGIRCKEIPFESIFENYNYLGQGPSDSFTKSAPAPINNYKDFYEAKFTPSDYSTTEGLFSPHSWSFFGGRGFQLQANTNNILGTMAFDAAIGQTSEEGKPFSTLLFSYAKYYPIFSLGLDYLGRKSTINTIESEWTETRVAASMALPYIHQTGVYAGQHILSITGQNIEVSENDFNSSSRLNNDALIAKTLGLSSSLVKNQAFRQIQPRWGYRLFADYTDIEQDQTNYFLASQIKFFLPGIKVNDGLSFTMTHEKRTADESLYQLNNNYVPLGGYTFSRGYAYEFSSEFNKLSLEYVTNLWFPNLRLGDWVYFQRLYSKAFFDTTVADIYLEDSAFEDDFQRRTLNSYGVELNLETNSLRKFPLSYGIRLLRNQRDERTDAEIIIGLNLR